MIVVDSMHNLFLGLFKEHFRHLLGFRIQKNKRSKTPNKVLNITIVGDIANPLPDSKPAKESVPKIISFLEQPMSDDLQDGTYLVTAKKQLERFHLPALLYVAKGVSCPGLYEEEILQPKPATSTKARKIRRANKIKPVRLQKKPQKLTKAVLTDILLKWVSFFAFLALYNFFNIFHSESIRLRKTTAQLASQQGK